MKTFLCIVFALAAGPLLPLRASDARIISITKFEDYLQAEDKPPVLNSPGAFSFYAAVEESKEKLVQSATILFPDGLFGRLGPSAQPNTLDYLDFFDNPLDLEFNYPPGQYQIEVVGVNDGKKTVSFDLPENYYPNAPRILNWSNLQQLQSDKPFEIRWEPFAEGTTNDFVQLSIKDLDDNQVFVSAGQRELDGLDGTSIAQKLPANLLKLGNEYRGLLIFGRIIKVDTNQYPGAVAITMFIRQTTFPIVTAGTEDLPNVRFEMSFTYLAYGGDFHQKSTLEPAFPLEFDDCYVARLFVRNEEFVPVMTDVTFSSPPGTALTNVESAFRYLQGDDVVFETPCLDAPSTNAMPGLWTISYNKYPLLFDVPDARPTERLVLPLATVTLDGSALRRVDWVYHDRQGTRLSRTPSFMTNLVMELYDEANFLIYTSGDIPPSLTSHALTSNIDWNKVRRMFMAYQDVLGNWYGVTLYHSPPPGLSILNDLLPLASINTPYQAQMVAANGAAPYRWSLDGSLPPGLKLDPATGLITGVPSNLGSFRFGIRVDDNANKFEYDTFFIRVTTNGPPIISTQPEGGSVELGDFTYFEVSAEGTQPLAYQWLFNGKPLTGETNDWLLLVDISTNQAGIYSVRVSNSVGSILSTNAPLAVLQPPVILKQPASQEVSPGTNVVFSVEVRSAPPIFYQWRHNGEVIEGATNSTYVIPNAQPFDSGSYSVLVIGGEGFVQSDEASLSFLISTLSFTNRFVNRLDLVGPSGLGRGSNGGSNRDPGEPVHAGIPGGSSVWVSWVAPADGIATFTTLGSDFDTLLAVYTGTAVDRLTEIVSDDDGEDFYNSRVRFNARAGQRYEIAIDGVYGSQGEILLNWSMDTSGSRLPEILRQPLDAIVAAGGTAIFSLQATNPPPATGPLIYQWYFDGLPIPDATNDTLVVSNIDDDKLGLYLASVVNDREFVLSDLVVIEISTDLDAISRRVTSEDKFANLSRQTNGLLALSLEDRLPKPFSSGGSVARGYTGSQVFSTTSSTTESGEPNHCGVVGGASQWYSYLAVTNGLLTIDTDGSDFDTVLSVYTGSDFDFSTLKQVACDNDGGADGQDSRVSFQAVAGTLYLIVVDGVRGAKGTAQLNYNLGGPPRLQVTPGGPVVNLKLTGNPRGVFLIETSTNLRDWTALLTTNSMSGVVELSARRLNNARFYRGTQLN